MTNLEKIKKYAAMYAVKSEDQDALNKAELYTVKSEKTGYEHLDFYPVGHNSSHFFYLAVDNEERIYIRSYESYWDVDTNILSREEYNNLLCSNDKDERAKAWDAEKEYENEHIHLVKNDNDLAYLGHW